jgi:formamidopyrimidine-DNA glycosylase
MPELPDVETFKRYIDSTSLHKKIKSIDVKNIKILHNIKSKNLKEKLKNKKFIETYRHGKYIFIKLSNNGYLILHFGMTGNIKYLKYEKSQPAHTRLLIGFENNYYLAFDNQRLLGKVAYSDDIKSFIEKKNIGKDVLEFDQDTFLELMSKKRGNIKTALMNQKIIAGIGNIYADEILFQSKIYPKTKINNLSEKKLKNIFKKLNEVLNIAIDAQADPHRFPKNFIIPHRHKDGKCPLDNKKLKIIKINGRTTYFCPNHQKN